MSAIDGGVSRIRADFMRSALHEENDADSSDTTKLTTAVSRRHRRRRRERGIHITPAGDAAIKPELDHLLRSECSCRPVIGPRRTETAPKTAITSMASDVCARSTVASILPYAPTRPRAGRSPVSQQNTDEVFWGNGDHRRRERVRASVTRSSGLMRTDFARGRISWVSPLARALLKSREGDRVRFQSPAGARNRRAEIAYRAID